jgi:heat shock protein 110kDa
MIRAFFFNLCFANFQDNNFLFLFFTSSCVAFSDRKRLIGVAAKNQFSSNPSNTIHNFKQSLGNVQKKSQLCDFAKLNESSDDVTICYSVNYRNQQELFHPMVITSMLLEKLKVDTNRALQAEVSGCVLAVPCYFSDTERKTFIAAAALAQLNCYFVIKETTAIAINYSFNKKFPIRQNVVFIDFGHSAIQVFVCAFENEKLEMLAESSEKIGGRDIDEALARHFIAKLQPKDRLESNEIFIFELLQEVEKVKICVSADDATFPLNLDHLFGEEIGQLSMNKVEMEEVCDSILQIIKVRLKECLNASGLQLVDISAVETVGGSSRIPFIKQIIQNVFEKKPRTTMNDEAIARGCLLRYRISRSKPNYEIVQKDWNDKLDKMVNSFFGKKKIVKFLFFRTLMMILLQKKLYVSRKRLRNQLKKWTSRKVMKVFNELILNCCRSKRLQFKLFISYQAVSVILGTHQL